MSAVAESRSSFEMMRCVMPREAAAYATLAEFGDSVLLRWNLQERA